MKKVFALGLAGGLLLSVAAAGIAATQPSKPDIANSRIKSSKRTAPLKSTQRVSPAGPKAVYVMDYWNTASAAFYTWSGTFYMSNLFKPDAGWYPLEVQSLEVLAVALDGATATGAAGVIDGVAVFDTSGNVLARQLGVNANVGTWVTVPMVPAPQIAAGNFYGGLWNDMGAGSPPAYILDAGYQGSAINWTAPPDEPFATLDGASAAAAGPFTIGASTYPTTSAASVRATIDSNVPVELMRFDAE